MHDSPTASQGADHALLELACAAREQSYRFITPTPSTHERVNSRASNQWASDLRDILGWNRCFESKVVSDELFSLMRKADLLEPTENGWRTRLRLSTLNDQMYWHSAYPTTEAEAVFFGPDSYRFVHAIGHALQQSQRPIRRAFDMGCGAGPGALNIALARPEAQVYAGDINDAALRLTAVNALIAGASNVQTCRSNLLAGVDGLFDLIVANPPYLNDPLARAYRHGGGSHGQDLAVAMLTAALPRLAPQGSLLLYTGAAVVNGQDCFLASAQTVLKANPQVSWRYRELDPDVFGEELDNPAYQNAERIAAVWLEVSVP